MKEHTNFLFSDWFKVHEAALGEKEFQETLGFINGIVKEFAQRALEYAQGRPGYMTSDQEKYMEKMAEVGLSITGEPGFEPAEGKAVELPNTDLIALGASRFMDRFEKYQSRTFDKFDNFSDFLKERVKTSNIKNLASRIIGIVQSEGGMEKQGKEEGESGVISYDSPTGDSGKTMAGQVSAKGSADEKERDQIVAGEERETAEEFFKVMTARSKDCFSNLYKQAQQKVASIGNAIYNQDPARGSNLYRNAAYAMYFAKYILEMIEQNPQKYEAILRKTLSVTFSKETTDSKKIKGDVQNLSAYQAELKAKLEREYRKLPEFQKGTEGYERGAVGRKAYQDADAMVKKMLHKNTDAIISGKVKLPDGYDDKEYLKFARQMTVDDINAALGKKKQEKKAAQARFGKHVAGLSGIHLALQVSPSGKEEASDFMMSEFAQKMQGEVSKDMTLLKALAIRAFLGLTGLAPKTKGCMNVAQALEQVPMVFREDIRRNVNLVGRAPTSSPSEEEETETENPMQMRTVKAGRSCDQILTIKGTTDVEKLRDLTGKFFDVEFPSKEFFTVAKTNIVEKAIFGTIIASTNATLDHEKSCDNPNFQFPFRGRHYDIYTQKPQKESVDNNDMLENLILKYEIHRLNKEIINDL